VHQPRKGPRCTGRGRVLLSAPSCVYAVICSCVCVRAQDCVSKCVCMRVRIDFTESHLFRGRERAPCAVSAHRVEQCTQGGAVHTGCTQGGAVMYQEEICVSPSAWAKACSSGAGHGSLRSAQQQLEHHRLSKWPLKKAAPNRRALPYKHQHCQRCV